MKIAISAQGNGPDSEMDPRFGRAKCFLLFDSDTKEYKEISNSQNLQSSSGAGIQAAKAVIDNGAEILISGNVGPKAFSTLDSAGVKIFLSEAGSVRSVIDCYLKGELKSANGANVEGHW
ncbi:MAG: NifB/NifX family molybdenum-iron cluster-binding protein [Spirochaetes bacterium]|nr:NifB/NifX family molybdenum-iron cluster-binding protein [Spirochaetota bacterium]